MEIHPFRSHTVEFLAYSVHGGSCYGVLRCRFFAIDSIKGHLTIEGKMERPDGYQIITDRIISQLESGVIPWRKTWKGDAEAPRNFISKKPYQGINAIMLAFTKFSSNFFLTANQAHKIGGRILSEQWNKGFPIVFWKIQEYADKNGKITKIPYIRYSTVYNLDQTEGIEVEEIDLNQIDFKSIPEAEEIMQGFIGKPEIQHNQQRAFYDCTLDIVNMPKKESFEKNDFYYSVLFHELTHATGAKQRLDREGITESHFFGSANYSKEELVAELGATFLCSECGLTNDRIIENSGSYIQGWLKKLRNDKKLVVSAASAARKATEYILGKHEKVSAMAE